MLPLVKNLSLEFYTNREVDRRGESLAIRKLPIDRPFIKQNYFPSLVEPEPEILAEIVSISPIVVAIIKWLPLIRNLIHRNS